MDQNLIALIIVLAYFAGLFIIAGFSNNAQKKKAKETGKEGAEGFLMASRSMTLPLVMTTIMGVAIGANATTGAAQGGYLFGFAAGTHPLWLGLSVTLVGLLLAKRYRRIRMFTVSQLYGESYGEDVRRLSSIGQIFMNFVIMVSQFIAGGSILSTLLPQYFTMTTGMIVSAVIFLLISIFGGWMSTATTNILNMVMCYLAVGLALYSVFTNPELGGLKGIFDNLGKMEGFPSKEVYLSPVKGIGWAAWLAYPVLMFCNVAAHQSQVQCITTAENEGYAKWGFIIGGLLVAPLGYLCALVGMGALKLYPELGQAGSAMAMPMFINNMSGVVAGLALAGLWAASVSTATNLAISASTLFYNDVYKPIKDLKNEKIDVKTQKRVSILGIVVFTAVSCFVAFYVKVLLNFAGAGLSLSVPFAVIVFITLFAPKIAKKSTAKAILITGYITMIVWGIFSKQLGPIFLHPVWLMSIVTILTVIACAIFDKRPAYFRTKAYRDKFVSMYWEDTAEYKRDLEIYNKENGVV